MFCYRIQKSNDIYPGSSRKKRAHPKEVRDKNVLSLYTKLAEVVSLLAELLHIQTLTDTAVLHTSSMAVSPFFVEEISELQLSALKLVTTVFKKKKCFFKSHYFLVAFITTQKLVILQNQHHKYRKLRE